jgi:hypothetical protein
MDGVTTKEVPFIGTGFHMDLIQTNWQAWLSPEKRSFKSGTPARTSILLFTIL